MACDRAFGHIEKYIRRVVNIYDLKGYVRAIQLCTTSRYHVIVLRNTDFLDVEVLQKSITHRKPKPPYSFQNARSFKLLSKFCEGYFICRDYTGQALGSVRLMKGQARYTRRMFDLSAVQLPQKYPKIRRLQPGKMQHRNSCLILSQMSTSRTFSSSSGSNRNWIILKKMTALRTRMRTT
ncbi:hypothetical protein GWK47_003587 [Chionoecetes opilio]|uniref:Uncharacterized protein n=1 Tax=Chionoecetes opilio TaxID=41210 RepID=A0A8J5D285_CHIOP|nr:hypothetical protein GWK47_003587 [Chionoecetes opilio]